MRYAVIDAAPEHIPAIAAGCRQADIDEVWNAAALTVTDALRISLKTAALARTWLIDGVPAAIGGVSKVGVGQGVIWLITTDLLDHHQRAFLAESRRELEQVREGYDLLYNFVDARNTRAIRWLQWLNFEMGPEIPYGVFRKPFRYFERRAA